jgi:hypothetical protein
MSAIAASLWLITAVVGTYMLSRTVSGSRNAAGATVSDLPVMLSFLHPALAVAGLAVFGAYMATLEESFVWIAFADLVLVSVLGELLFTKWLKGRRAAASTSSPVRRITAEQSIPVEIVALHGLLAGATILLVLLVALRA